MSHNFEFCVILKWSWCKFRTQIFLNVGSLGHKYIETPFWLESKHNELFWLLNLAVVSINKYTVTSSWSLLTSSSKGDKSPYFIDTSVHSNFWRSVASVILRFIPNNLLTCIIWVKKNTFSHKTIFFKILSPMTFNNSDNMHWWFQYVSEKCTV